MRHISASQIGLYADCSLKYKFRYIDQIAKPAESVHLVYGSSVHKALEELNKSLINEAQGGKRLPLWEVFNYYNEAFLSGLKEQNISDSGYIDRMYDMGIFSIEKFYQNYLDYEPILVGDKPGVEINFDLPLEWKDFKNENYTLFGYIDLVAWHKGNIVIIDYKTSKAPYEPFKIKTSVQLVLYAYAMKKLLESNIIQRPSTGKPLKKKEADYISYYVLEKDYQNFDGNITMQKKKIKEYEIDRVFHIIETMIKGIENDVYIPNYNSLDCKWCEYKKECLDWS